MAEENQDGQEKTEEPSQRKIDKYKEVIEKQMISELIEKKNINTVDSFMESQAKKKILDKIEIIDKYRAIIEEY